MTDYTRVRKLADFLLARQLQSGVSIDAADTELLTHEIQHILIRVATLEAIIAADDNIPNDIKARLYND